MYKKLKSTLSIVLTAAMVISPIPVQVETLPTAVIEQQQELVYHKTETVYNYEGLDYEVYYTITSDGVMRFYILLEEEEVYLPIDIDPDLVQIEEEEIMP